MLMADLIGKIKGVDWLVLKYGPELTPEQVLKIPRKELIQVRNIGPRVAFKIKKLVRENVSKQKCNYSK